MAENEDEDHDAKNVVFGLRATVSAQEAVPVDILMLWESVGRM